MADLRIRATPLAKLHPNPRNPRTISESRFAALKDSLAADPDMLKARPVIALPDGTILAGNQRWRAAEALGWKTIPAVTVDLDDERAKTWLLRDNVAYGENDEDLLAELLYELEQSSADLLPLTGFPDDELQRLLDSVRGDSMNGADPDAVPPVPAEPISKTGEVYELGEAKHRLLCGDSTSPEALALLFGDNRASLLVTDPPYGVSYAAKNEFLNSYDNGNRIQSEIENDQGTPEEMSEFWRAAFTAVRPFLAPGSGYYVTGPQGGDLLLLLLLALRDCEFPLRHMLIWAKNNHVLGRSDYHYQHEPIIYGWVKGSHRFHGPPGETSLWEIDRPMASKLHPTAKPVELYARAMRNSSKRGEIVFDPFAGSGTAVIAAEQTGRRAFAAEVDPGYCDVIRQRYAEFVG